MKRIFHTLWVCLAITILCACGWQLRGSINLPDALRELRVESSTPTSLLTKNVERALRIVGVVPLAPGQQGYSLRLYDEKTVSREVTVDRRARSAEREMAISVMVLVNDPLGEPVHGPVRISGSRIYTYDPNNVIAKQDEEELLTEELTANLSQQILHVLEAAGGALQDARAR